MFLKPQRAQSYGIGAALRFGYKSSEDHTVQRGRWRDSVAAYQYSGVGASGGNLILGPMQVPDGAWGAQCQDVQRALFSVVEPG
jgi:hypothetical protein